MLKRSLDIFISSIDAAGDKAIQYAKMRRDLELEEEDQRRQDEIEAEMDKPVISPSEWISNEYYCGSFADTTFPKIKEIFLDVAENNLFEIVLGGSIGWGKTTFAMLLHLWSVYLLSRKANPHGAYRKMNRNAAIASMVLNVTLEKAKKAYWKQFVNSVWSIPYFQSEFAPNKRLVSRLEFPNNMIHSPFGASENAAESENLIFVVLDEANLYDEVEKSARADGGKYDEATVVYNAAKNRMQNRFMLPDGSMPEPSFLIALCKETYPDSFIRKLINEIRDKKNDVDVTLDDGTVRKRTAGVYEFAEWDVRRDYYNGKKFWIRTSTRNRDAKIITELDDLETEKKMITEMKKSGYGDDDSGVIIDVLDNNNQIMLNSARGNIDLFLRDRAGRPTQTIGRFFRNKEKIRNAIRRHGFVNPVTGETIDDRLTKHAYTLIETDFRDRVKLKPRSVARWNVYYNNDGEMCKYWTPAINPTTERYVHVDMGLTNDAAGISICHIAGYVMRSKTSTERETFGEVVDYKLPYFWVDLMLRVLPPGGGEQIRFSDIKQIVMDFQRLGFKFKAASADGYQSANLLQDFSDMGMDTAVVSVDRTIEPYSLLRDLFNEERIAIYEHDIVLGELYNLERGVKAGMRHGKRVRIEWVDHPTKGTKDVSDSLAGCITTANKYVTQKSSLSMVGKIERDTIGIGFDDISSQKDSRKRNGDNDVKPEIDYVQNRLNTLFDD